MAQQQVAQQQVVVGVDASATAQTALRWAVQVAGCYGASVEAVHAWRWDTVGDMVLPDPAAELAAAARQTLDGQLEKALGSRPAGDSPVPVRGSTPEGDPATALVEAAAPDGLLVLGRHGQGRWQRKLIGPTLGSVAGHCLDHASVPVVIVPPDAPATAPARVLVGIDGSAASARALRWAVRHADAVGAPVVAVFAWQLTTITPPASTREDWSVPPLSEWEAQARTQLDGTVTAALPPEQAERVERLLLHRPPAAGLLEAAGPDDLLVLGERGRGGFARLLLGSVSRQCAEHAPCPVVVVPGRAGRGDAA